jgi:hypothetical protein
MYSPVVVSCQQFDTLVKDPATLTRPTPWEAVGLEKEGGKAWNGGFRAIEV